MYNHRTWNWWGLYALFPLLIGMMLLDEESRMSETWHNVLLAAIVILFSLLAVAWVERHPRLVERAGIDAPLTYRILPETATRQARGSESSEEPR